jgi:2-iminoacetate synthase ThiH
VLNRLIRHVKRWNKWRKYCGNGWLHKISVLFSGCSPTFQLVLTDEEEEEIHMAVMRAIEEQEEHMQNEIAQNRMTTEEAKDIITNDPSGDIVKRMEAIAVARSVLGEDCTMEEIWKWAEGGDKNVEALI